MLVSSFFATLSGTCSWLIASTPATPLKSNSRRQSAIQLLGRATKPLAGAELTFAGLPSPPKCW